MTAVPDRVYRPHGGAAELFQCSDREVLYEGPAGTGKTRAVLEYIDFLCESVPGLRVLFLRDTRVNLTETVLSLFEEEVLGEGHPAMHGTAKADNRRTYEYPATRAKIVLGGLDSARRYMSGQFDVIVLFEATDVRDEGKWQKLTTRLRSWKLWYQQIIADCNPADEFHFLNVRASRFLEDGSPVMRRVHSYHKDNARWYDHERGRWRKEGRGYMDTLEAMTGSDRDRYLLGKWVSSEGAALGNWTPRRHVVVGSIRTKESNPSEFQWNDNACLDLDLEGGCRGPEGQTSIEIRWCLGAIDWGHREPGCFQVWGVDADRNLFRLAEVYECEKNIDWWAERILPLIKRYKVRSVYADPSRDDNISLLNDRLGPYMGRDGGRVVTKANNDREAGFDLVSWALGQDEDDQRAWWVTSGQAHVGLIEHQPDRSNGRELRAFNKLRDRGVWASEMEFPGLVWAERKEGHQGKEEFHPESPDHGYDTTRYAFMGAWRDDQHRKPPAPDYDPESVYYKSNLHKADKIDRERTAEARKRFARDRRRANRAEVRKNRRRS